MNGDQVTGLPWMVTQRVGCVACPRTLGKGRVLGTTESAACVAEPHTLRQHVRSCFDGLNTKVSGASWSPDHVSRLETYFSQHDVLTRFLGRLLAQNKTQRRR